MSLFDIICLSGLAYLTVLTLIYRRHAAEAKWWATENEAKFQKLFEEVPLACQETDVDGIIRRVNQKLCDLRGLKPSDILGKHHADFAGENERERFRYEIGRKLAGELPPARQKQTYLPKDGEIITDEVHETTLRDGQGAIVGLR